jgi:two-component sensor histidine kinase
VNAAPIHNSEGDIVAGVAVFPDITAIKTTEEQLRGALEEKEVLVREVHHRVKNNMNTISGLLYLQSRHTTSESTVSALHDCQNRILSMARVHEHLYRSNSFAEVNMAAYIDILVADIRESYGTDNVSIRTSISGVSMSVDHAIPCGLIASELVSNAMKYAFEGRDSDNLVEISLTRRGGMVTFDVSDNGIGLPQSLSVDKSDSLGLKLVQMLTRQLDGKLYVQSSPKTGACFTVEFPLPASGPVTGSPKSKQHG